MINRNLAHRYTLLSILAGLLLALISCGGGKSEQQMLQSAKDYIDQGDYKAASIELRNTLQANKDNAEARYLQGSIYMNVGRYDAALQAFEHASKGGWDTEQAQIYKAQIYIEQKKPQELLDNIPDNDTWSNQTRADILSLHAVAQAMLKHTQQAKNTLAKATTLQADSLHVLKTTTMFQLSSLLEGDPAETVEKALSLYPDNKEILYLHGIIDSKNNQVSRASDTYKKIISLEPANMITPYGRKAAIALANIYVTQKKYPQVTTTLAKILARNENDPVANYLSGIAAYNEKKYQQAETYVQKILNALPEHNQSLQLMGRLKYINKDYYQASQNFEKYLKAVPDDLDTKKILAQTYIQLKQIDKAQPIVDTLLTNNSKDVGALRLQSQILFSQGNTSASISTLIDAINLKPDDAGLYEQLIKAYITLGKTDQALSEISKFQSLTNDTITSQKLTISAYLQAKQINEAIVIANEMLETNPKDVEIISLNGSLHAANKDYDKARFYFEKALQQQNNLSATIGLARINRDEGKLDKARSLYKNLIDAGLGNATPMLALSEIAAQVGNENEMLSWLEKARSASPKETRARLILAGHYLKNAKPKEADIYIQEALKIAPENTETQLLQSKILIAQKRYSEALTPLNKLIKKFPDSIDIHTLLGETYLRQNMTSKAREHLLNVLNKNNSHLMANILMADLEFQERNYKTSLGYSKNIQKILPDSYIGYMLEGNAWMVTNNYQRAYTVYSRAWQLQQTSELAIKLFSASKSFTTFDDASKPLLSWLSNNPDDTVTRLFLAVAYQSVEQNDDAINEYEIILQQEPNNEAALNNLAWLYSLSGDSRSLTLAEKAYRSDPNNADILDTYGWILVQQKQAAQGVKLIKQALDQKPEVLEIQYHYAVALLNAGDPDQGKIILRQLLDQKKPFFGRKDAEQLFNTL